MAEVFEDAWINTNRDPKKWIRVDPETGGLYRYNEATEQYDILLPIPIEGITGLQDALDGKAESVHSHPEHGDINFTGNISVAGDAGITGQKTVGGYQITFKKGILTGFQAV